MDDVRIICDHMDKSNDIDARYAWQNIRSLLHKADELRTHVEILMERMKEVFGEKFFEEDYLKTVDCQRCITDMSEAAQRVKKLINK